MSAGIYNMTIEQGSTFKLQLVCKDDSSQALNLAGYSARMKVKSTYGTEALLSISSPNDGIVITNATGTLDLTISAATPAALVPQSAVYDLEIESAGGEVTKLIRGKTLISPEVTV